LTPLPPEDSVIARLAAAEDIVRVASGNLADLEPPLASQGGISISEALQEIREDKI